MQGLEASVLKKKMHCRGTSVAVGNVYKAPQTKVFITLNGSLFVFSGIRYWEGELSTDTAEPRVVQDSDFTSFRFLPVMACVF